MDCKHVHLIRLEGPIHEGGKYYVCDREQGGCGELFTAEPLVIGVQFGKMPEKEGGS